MFKNQLQELAQRSCFNLPSYACVREGPDHAPRFKAYVNFNGEIFESPSYCTTLRQAEHAAAEVALNVLSSRCPSRSLTARVLDETGIYKNLLQETAHRAGLNLPVYTTVRSGPGHVPIFTSSVELAGMSFTGEPAKTKKQAEKNAAIAAWSALKRMPNLDSLTNKEAETREEHDDQVVVARVLSNLRSKDENKQSRKRDHNQARRRVIRGHRDTSPATSSSLSSSNNSSIFRHSRLLDVLLDSSLDGPTTLKRNSFVSLLPPPPPRTASKILPPTIPEDNPFPSSSSRQIPIQTRVQSQVQMQEVISVPLEECAMKHEEKSPGYANKKPFEREVASDSNSNGAYGPFPLSHLSKLGTSLLNNNITAIQHKPADPLIKSSHFGSSVPSPMASTSINAAASSSIYPPTRPMHTGGFNPHRIAPAVQIRSVIPVCAAPALPNPIRPPPSSSASSSSASASITTSKSTQTSTTNKRPDESHPTQLSPQFCNKLQLSEKTQ